MPKLTLVYWLHDARCVDPERDGYVGLTCNIRARMQQHARGGRFPTFSYMILFAGSRVECSAEEKRLRPNPGMGWNSFSGGYGGRQPSKATKARMSAASKARMSSDEARSKISAALVGRIHSEDHRAKIGDANKRRVVSEATRSKMSARMKGNTQRAGIKHTDEAKAKVSAARKRKA
jgi:hypothetical protein